MIPVRYCKLKSYPEELARIKELFPHLADKVYINSPELSEDISYVDPPAYFKMKDRDGMVNYLILTEDRAIEYDPDFHPGTGTLNVDYNNYEHPDGSANPYALPPNATLLDEEELEQFKKELSRVVENFSDLLYSPNNGEGGGTLLILWETWKEFDRTPRGMGYLNHGCHNAMARLTPTWQDEVIAKLWLRHLSTLTYTPRQTGKSTTHLLTAYLVKRATLTLSIRSMVRAWLLYLVKSDASFDQMLYRKHHD